MRSGPKTGRKKAKDRNPAKKIIFNHHKPAIEATEAYHKKEAMEWSENQDWERWQDEFEKRKEYRVFDYPNIQAFAIEKAAGNEDVERWIRKSIGPKPMKEIKWQGDWALERVFHISKEAVELDLLQKKVLEDRDILNLTIPVAASYAPWKSHLDTVRSKILELLDGDILEPRPKFNNKKEQKEWETEQRRRLDWYQDQMERVFEFKQKIDTMYLKSLGIDAVSKNSIQLEQAIIKILSAKGIQSQLPASTQQEYSDTTTEAKIWMDAVTMEIAKARAFDMPLPDDYKKVEKLLEKKKIIDIKAE